MSAAVVRRFRGWRWPKAGMGECTAHVRFWGKSGHMSGHRTSDLQYLLMLCVVVPTETPYEPSTTSTSVHGSDCGRSANDFGYRKRANLSDASSTGDRSVCTRRPF